jgi:hypothetical protein
VYRHLKRSQSSRYSTKALKPSGRPLEIGPEMAAYIKAFCLNHRFRSITDLRKGIEEELKCRAPSRGCIHNWFQREEIKWRKCRPKPVLTDVNKLKRLRYAKEMLRRDRLGLLPPLVNVDEFHVLLHPKPNSRTNGVWVEIGRKPPDVPADKHPIQLSFFAVVTPDGPGPILCYEGNVTSTGYVAMLREVLPWLRNRYGNNFVLQHDGAPPHEAEATTLFLREEQVNFMSSGRNGFQPPFSPDLAIVENCIGSVKQRVVKCQSKTKEELKQHVLDLWSALSPELVKRCYASLPNRWAEVVLQGGGCTRY